MIDCLIKKDICDIEFITWRLKFSRNVTKFLFDDYSDLSFNRIYRYSTL